MFKIYPKSSFDRFGDDLIELVLSYISFEDCFQYKCVSKQWKYLLFNKQNQIFINDCNYRYINVNVENKRIEFIRSIDNENKFKAIELVLKNCPNITSIFIRLPENQRHINKVFELIIKYCNKLNEIEFSTNGLTLNTIEKFCHKFGSKMKKNDFNNRKLTDIDTILNKFYKLCPNLTHLYVRRLTNAFNENEVLYKNFKSIEFIYFSEDKRRLEALIKSNKNSLQSIKVNIGFEVNESDLKVLFKSIESVPNLKCFSLNVISNITITSFIGNIGLKLIKFKYNSSSKTTKVLNFVKTINKFEKSFANNNSL